MTNPPTSPHFLVSFPNPHTLLVTINRPNQRNSIPSDAHWDAHALFSWFDEEPSLLVAIITGAGDKAFCAGQDLTEQAARKNADRRTAAQDAVLNHPPSGFLGLSQRKGKKPVLAAVNGFALGGGFETCLNCDMVVASPTAQFGLPEISVGLYAAAGGLARIVKIVGYPLASELALTARRVSAQEALDYRLINRVSPSPVETCLALAEEMGKYSPDAIIVTRQGLREAWETDSVERATTRVRQEYGTRLMQGENFRIGVEAFAKKMKPRWVPSRL